MEWKCFEELSKLWCIPENMLSYNMGKTRDSSHINIISTPTQYSNHFQGIWKEPLKAQLKMQFRILKVLYELNPNKEVIKMEDDILNNEYCEEEYRNYIKLRRFLRNNE